MTSAFSRRAAFAAYSGGAVAIGYALRGADEEQKRRQLPMGWRACCESRALTPAQQALPDKLTAIVGALNVERGVEQRGSRMGRGEAFVVVKPGSLREALEALQACVDADACVIPQAREHGSDWRVGAARDGRRSADGRHQHAPAESHHAHRRRQAHGVPRRCRHPFGVAKGRHAWQGISFRPRLHLPQPDNRGGHRLWLGRHAAEEGARLERLLYARVNAHGKVELIDSLGIVSSDDDELFRKLESGELKQEDVDGRCGLAASQTTYGSSVCACHGKRQVCPRASTFDGRTGSSIRIEVLILASVIDTFDKPVNASTLWISVDDFATAQRLKRDVCLAGGAADLPVSCEVSHWWDLSQLSVTNSRPFCESYARSHRSRSSFRRTTVHGPRPDELSSPRSSQPLPLTPLSFDHFFVSHLYETHISLCYLLSPRLVLAHQVDVGREAPASRPPHPDGRHHRRQGALPPQLALPQRAAVAGACPDREARPPSPGRCGEARAFQRLAAFEAKHRVSVHTCNETKRPGSRTSASPPRRRSRPGAFGGYDCDGG